MIKKYLVLIILLSNQVVFSAQDLPDRASLIQLIKEGGTDSIKAEAVISMADSYEELNIDSALYYLGIAPSMIDTSKSNLLSAKYFHSMSKIKRIDGQANEALYYGKRARAKYSDHEDTSLYGFISIAIAEAYHRSTDYVSALEYGLEGATIGEKTKDSLLIAESLNMRGNIMRETNRLDEALKLFKEHFMLLKALGQEEASARSLTNIGIVNAIQSNPDTSYTYFRKAINIAQRYDNDYLIAFAAGSLGQTYSTQNVIDSAIVYLNMAQLGFSKVNNFFGETFTANQLGALYNKSKRYDLTLETLLPAYERSKKLSTTRLTDGIVRGIGTAYEKLGEYKLAYQYQEIHIALKDSMVDEQVLNAISEAEAKYQNEKKQLEIERLSLQDELNNVRINRQRIILGGFIIGFSILTFLLYSLFGQNKKIKTQNSLISKAHNEKEILLKEIHHRVKNNLQVISSLLSMQSRSIKDEVAKEAIIEGKNRVHSMSLIHQNLYKKDNLAGIVIKDYLPKLSKNLIETYKTSKGNVSLKTDIDDLTLDVETIVPIGLIVNELISNSLKYAFPNSSDGSIEVTLKEIDDHLLLSVSDNGIGLSEDQLQIKKDSFGHSLIRAFRNKLNADIEVNGSDGTTISLKIKKYKKIA